MRALRWLVRLFLSLLQAFQKEQGDDRLEDEEPPGPGIVEDFLEQLEEASCTEQLSEVVSREQEDKSLRKSSTASELALRVDGPWRRKPRRIAVQTPKSETELRANAWEFVRIKKTHQEGVLRDLKPATWEKWSLSDKVARHSVTMGQQTTEFLIRHEWQVRRRVGQGHPRE